jgi:hypothetical protein
LDVNNEIRAKYVKNDSSDCSGTGAEFFIQIPCMIPEVETRSRQVKGLFIACCGVFIGVFYLLYMDYLSSIFKLAYIEWDVKTITAGDYSVEMTITNNMWNNFTVTKYNHNDPSSKLSQFRDYLQHELETRLT